MSGSWAAARGGAACALAVAQAVLGGERCAMALTRPSCNLIAEASAQALQTHLDLQSIPASTQTVPH